MASSLYRWWARGQLHRCAVCTLAANRVQAAGGFRRPGGPLRSHVGRLKGPSQRPRSLCLALLPRNEAMPVVARDRQAHGCRRCQLLRVSRMLHGAEDGLIGRRRDGHRQLLALPTRRCGRPPTPHSRPRRPTSRPTRSCSPPPAPSRRYRRAHRGAYGRCRVERSLAGRPTAPRWTELAVQPARGAAGSAPRERGPARRACVRSRRSRSPVGHPCRCARRSPGTRGVARRRG